MTLVAATSNHGHPIILGDLLLSSSKKSDSFQLPTFLREVERFVPDNSSYFPVSLMQKIYVIKDNLAIGLAGEVRGMTKFLELIRHHFSDQCVTHEAVTEFLDMRQIREIEEIAFLILLEYKVGGESKFIFHYDGSWKSENNKLFENILAIGSGSTDFLKQADEYRNEMRKWGISSSYDKALSQNFILINNLLGIESLTLATIQKYWGAGFEVISFSEGKFSKYSNLTYMVWKGHYDENGDLNLIPLIVLKYAYYKDLLLIISIEGHKMDAVVVPELDMDISTVDLKQIPFPSLNSQHISSSFFITDRAGMNRTISIFLEERIGFEQFFVEKNATGNVEIRISEQLYQKIVWQINGQE